MLKRYRGWSGALTVMVITAVLVVLDVTNRSVHRYWSRHSFPPKKRTDAAVAELRQAAAPLLEPLNRAQRAAVSSEDDGQSA